jgi:hypothetical protein
MSQNGLAANSTKLTHKESYTEPLPVVDMNQFTSSCPHATAQKLMNQFS